MSSVSRWYGIRARRAMLRFAEYLAIILFWCFAAGAFLGGVAGGFRVVCKICGVDE